MSEIEPRFKQAPRATALVAGLAVAFSGCAAPRPTESQSSFTTPPSADHTLALSSTAASAINSSPSLTPEPSRSHEVLPAGPTEFGFNTHLRTGDDAGNMTLDSFEANVDRLVEAKSTWIRFDFRDWEAIDNDQANPDNIPWNPAGIEAYDKGISYAKQKGLKVFLVTTGPSFANSYEVEENYLKSTSKFYKNLAERYKDQVDIWQVLNESEFKDRYGNIAWEKQFDLEHLDVTALVLKTARDAIKSVDPNSIVTTNILARKYGDNGETVDIAAKAHMIFARFAPYLDAISLNFYPDHYPLANDPEQVDLMPALVTDLSEKYNMPVYVTELGLPVNNNDVWTEKVQGKALVTDLDAIKGGRIPAAGVILYEMMDENVPDVQGVEASFGLWKADGSQKQSLLPVIADIQPAISPIPTPSK